MEANDDPLFEAVNQVTKPDLWGLGNEVLYSLCRSYPKHEDENHIFAKIWLIGRAYSASIERRRSKNQERKLQNWDYYKMAVETIKNSDIDQWISDLKKEIPAKRFQRIIFTHGKVVELFREISGIYKRSLASKYLHFHFPDYFFIYDSRAVNAIKNYKHLRGEGNRPSLEECEIEEGSKIDKNYYAFVCNCLNLQDYVRTTYNVSLDPRQIDRILLGGKV